MTGVTTDEQAFEAAADDAVDEQLVEQLAERARSQGLQLTGEGGLLAQLTKRVVESAAEGELADHLGYDKHDAAGRNGGNSRNGTRDLELDCVHDLPDHGSWLKVPLGKLETERMIPIDEEILALIDHITEIRCHGRPLPHPRYRRRAQFLFTHHGRRLSQNAVRAELDRAAAAAGLDHITPHQLRHTYATALVNAGASLQALMALLGHVSAAMSLRYGRLFDHTVRAEYERALDLAKQQLQAPTTGTINLPLTDITGGADWEDTPLLKSWLAGGFCLRAPAQGACPYANICEHCPSFHTDASSLPILAAQRVDAQALAHDAEARGWITEAERHQHLIARLDTLISKAQTG